VYILQWSRLDDAEHKSIRIAVRAVMLVSACGVRRDWPILSVPLDE